MKQNTSPPVTRKNIERAHVSFAREPPLNRSEYNPAVMVPITKSMIIDSPLTLALAGLDDCKEEDRTCGAIEPTEADKNQVNLLYYNFLFHLINLNSYKLSLDKNEEEFHYYLLLILFQLIKTIIKYIYI